MYTSVGKSLFRLNNGLSAGLTVDEETGVAEFILAETEEAVGLEDVLSADAELAELTGALLLFITLAARSSVDSEISILDGCEATKGSMVLHESSKMQFFISLESRSKSGLFRAKSSNFFHASVIYKNYYYRNKRRLGNFVDISF